MKLVSVIEVGDGSWYHHYECPECGILSVVNESHMELIRSDYGDKLKKELGIE